MEFKQDTACLTAKGTGTTGNFCRGRVAAYSELVENAPVERKAAPVFFIHMIFLPLGEVLRHPLRSRTDSVGAGRWRIRAGDSQILCGILLNKLTTE